MATQDGVDCETLKGEKVFGSVYVCGAFCLHDSPWTSIRSGMKTCIRRCVLSENSVLVCVAIDKVPVLGKTTVEQRADFTQKLPVKTQQVPNFLFTY